MIKNVLLSSSLKNQFASSHLRNRIFESNLINSTSQLNVNRNSRVLRRRITRLENDFEVGEEEIEQNKLSDNDRPNQRIKSKNPRNLEQLLYEQKALGWELDLKSRSSFWNKIEFDKKEKYVTGKVVHHSGKVLIEVSENDASLKGVLFGKDSLTVANVIGQIVARRCFESGIQYVHCDFSENELISKKLTTFIESLKRNGLILKEPEFIVARRSNKDI